MNYTNQTSYIIDEKFLLRIGSTWVIDTLYLIVISPMGFIGFILNLISFGVLTKVKIRDTKIYEYLKIYSLNSSLICLSFGFMFSSHSPRYFSDFTDELAKIFKCRIFAYGMTSLYFFNNLLDILIILDRISIFTTKLNRLGLIKPYILCLILLSLCSMTNLILYFSIKIAPDEIFISSNLSTYCEQTDFARSTLGFIINLIVIILRDILTLIVEIMCSLILIYCYKRYEKMSLNLIVTRLNQNLNDINLSQIQRSINEKNIRKNLNDERKIRKKEKGKQLLLMIIILSIFSFITHMISAFVFVFLVLIYFENRLIYYSIVAFGCFSMVFKHSITIFVFYFFNINFKKKFIKIFFNN